MMTTSMTEYLASNCVLSTHRKASSWLMHKSMGEACTHNQHKCGCAVSGRLLQQDIREMDFERSAAGAAHAGQLQRLRSILHRHPGSLACDGARDRAGYTALHYAARAGHHDVVQYLLEEGAPVDATTSSGNATSLHKAAVAGHLHIVKTLVSCGADGRLQDVDGETPLHKAAAKGYTEVLEFLLHTFPGASDIRDRHGRTAQQCLCIPAP